MLSSEITNMDWLIKYGRRILVEIILIHSGNQGFGAVGSHDPKVLECQDGEKILLLIQGRGFLWVHSKMAVAGDISGNRTK